MNSSDWTNIQRFAGLHVETYSDRADEAPTEIVHSTTGLRLQRDKSGKTAASFCAKIWQRLKNFFVCGSRPKSMGVVAGASGSTRAVSGESRSVSTSTSTTTPAPVWTSPWNPDRVWASAWVSASAPTAAPALILPPTHGVVVESAAPLSPAEQQCKALYQELVTPGKTVSDQKGREIWEKFEEIYGPAHKKASHAIGLIPGKLSRNVSMEAHAQANKEAADGVVNFFFEGKKTAELTNELMRLKDVYRPIFDGLKESKYFPPGVLATAESPWKGRGRSLQASNESSGSCESSGADDSSEFSGNGKSAAVTAFFDSSEYLDASSDSLEGVVWADAPSSAAPSGTASQAKD